MKEKITFENKINTPFTWVENDLIRSKSLSYEAMGLYLTLRSFGGISYPSIDYLCNAGKAGRDKLHRLINELIEAKLLLKKQKKDKGLFSRTIYRILSLNDDYESIYKEFTGEESQKPQSLDNSQSHPCPEKPSTDYPLTENPPPIKIIREEESNKEKSHIGVTVCEEKIKNTKTFENSNPELIKKIIKKNGKEAVIAAEYIDKVFSGQIIKNPLGLLIRTLERGTYSELPPEKINNLNAEIVRINAEYKGFKIQNEKIKEFLNIGGRIAFNTDNCLREIIYTPAKNAKELKKYLRKINSSTGKEI